MLHADIGILETRQGFGVYHIGAPKPVEAPSSAEVSKKSKKKGSKGDDNTTTSTSKSAKIGTSDGLVMSEETLSKYESVLRVGEECLNESELKNLLLTKVQRDGGTFNLYDGFEPSGRMHCAQGVFKAMNVNRCTSAGGTFIFWVADWFALMNDKMGGDLSKIKVVGEYLKQVWTASGMDMSDGKVVFKWASDEITNNASIYWPKMLDIARRFTISRIKKCCQIMGRLEGNLTAAQVLYPLMQCTDVFFLKADVCQLGVDQRKVNMLAREYCDAAKIKFKPVILSHHMLYGLKAGQEKMSKSDPDSAIFMEDTVEDVERKINNAYCPMKEEESATNKAAAVEDAGKESMHLVEDKLKNPCLDYVQYIVFGPPGATFTAGGKTYDSYPPIRADFVEGRLSEIDLKSSLASAINELLEPVRQHFTNDPTAKSLLEKVRQYKKEPAPVQKTFRRFDAAAAGTVPTGCHLVFAPAPVANPSLQLLVDVLCQLKSGSGSPVLLLSDWSACVLSACDADVKAINAYFTVLVKSLAAVDDEFMKGVTVVRQSDMILKDPSNYWIAAINCGRAMNLDVVQAGHNDESRVGIVINRLMMAADAVCIAPKSVGVIGGSEGFGDVAVVKAYFDTGIPVDSFEVKAVLKKDMRLQDVEAVHATDNTEYYLSDDPKVAAKAKMKKSFAEPGNLDFCPALELAGFFLFDMGGSLSVQRSPENGGDKTYQTAAEVRADYSSGALHPGDLKASVTVVMFDVLDKFAKGAKADKEWTKDKKSLVAFAKKLSKQKKNK